LISKALSKHAETLNLFSGNSGGKFSPQPCPGRLPLVDSTLTGIPHLEDAQLGNTITSCPQPPNGDGSDGKRQFIWAGTIFGMVSQSASHGGTSLKSAKSWGAILLAVRQDACGFITRRCQSSQIIS
jgi:hypothetical protein